MAFDVMISYNSDDFGLGHGLNIALKSRGHTVWFDREQTVAGTGTETELEGAVRQSQFVCGVVTPRYGRTYYTRLEHALAKKREGILAPVRFIPCLFEGELPSFMTEVNYVDFRRGRWNSGLDGLERTLAAHGADQDRRMGNAKLAGFATLVLGGLAWWNSAGNAARENTVRALLDSLKVHTALATKLRAAGHQVPAKKLDRIDAAIKAFGATPELVASVVSYGVRRDLCGQAGVSTSGKAVVLAERVLVALESGSA